MVRATVNIKQSGFSYLALLMIMSITSIGMAAVGAIWSFEAQRQKEKELHFRGNAYAAAIKSYYASQPNAKLYPKSIDDLIEDQRGVKIKRHLRQPYPDPMSRDGEWEFLKQGDFIVGVRSQSQQKIINKQLFSAIGSRDEVSKYDDIVFSHAAAQRNVDSNNASADTNKTTHNAVNTQTEPEEQAPVKTPPAPTDNTSSSDNGYQLPARVQKILDEYNAWLENELKRMHDAIKSK